MEDETGEAFSKIYYQTKWGYWGEMWVTKRKVSHILSFNSIDYDSFEYLEEGVNLKIIQKKL